MRTATIKVYESGIPLGNGVRQFYWSLYAANGKIVADGSEAYATKSNAKRAALRATRLMMQAAIELAKS